jgi:UDP-N-acetylmuramoyl-L-alanyl-D-glutamate--2,6-diaminopimelate ligase
MGRDGLFCALAGTRSHGMEFAAVAAAKGAAAILAEPAGAWDAARIASEQPKLGIPVLALPTLSQRLSIIAGRFHGEPARGLDLVAVTGTNGKTSVCQFTAQALDGERCCGIVGTLGFGFPGDLTPGTHTTPDAIRLQEILAKLRSRGASAVAMEVSSHALAQGRAAGLPIRTAIFTNLTRDHLDYHGDMQDYAQAKRRLFHLPGLAHALLNADDPFGWDILRSLSASVEPVLYGLDADWSAPQGVRWLRATEVRPDARGLHLRIAGSWGEGTLKTPLLGRFNAANLLAVLGVLLLRGWDLEGALARLAEVRGVPGRMERFGRPGQPQVVVDYAHTPDALEQALTALRSHQPRRLICLFGCGGERDRGKRPQMGAVAEHFADLSVVTDDNPRGEDGDAIVAEILAGMQAPARAKVERNRGRAIRWAVCLAAPRDIVLVAGKGHESVQKVGDLELPFSDRAQVTQVLQEWGGCAE